MTNIFLYAVKPSRALTRIEQFVRRCCQPDRLILLPPGSQFTSPLCLQLRSNDLIILFAQDDEDIRHLLCQRDEYESFRIILVLEDENRLVDRKYSLLSPRFISYSNENLQELAEYLTMALNRPSNNHSFPVYS